MLKDNARCALRTIREIVLENEHGAQRKLVLSKALPLYESDANDGGNLRPTQVGTLYNETRQLTSLGKACVSTNGDMNDNGRDDVSESSADGSSVTATRGWSTARLGYYREYTRYSFFIEQHEAYFESDAEGSTVGRYVIRERQRTDGSWPVYKAATVPSPVRPFWDMCYREADGLYGTPGVTSYAGGDFVQLGGFAAADWSKPWPGMGHHSQFKCVQYATTEVSYGANTQASAPQRVFGPDGALQRKLPGGGTETLPWRLSSCAPTAPSASTGIGRNPLNAKFACSATLPVEGNVYWAAVEYKDYEQSNQYVRGCIAECIDKTPDAASCPQCVTMTGDFGRSNCPVLLKSTIEPLGPTSGGGVPELGNIRILEQTLLFGGSARVCSGGNCVTGGLSP